MSIFISNIGLEVHVQLNTNSKIFAPSGTVYGVKPNQQAGERELALPGVLPTLNREAVRMAVKFGLSVDATINMLTVFARKHYLYPDLSKGYQITQDQFPIVSGGKLDIFIEGKKKTIGITRAHLEEDAGKSVHDDQNAMTNIDFNRAGMPLLEIVSEPDLKSAKEAVAYLKTLHSLVTYLDICTGNMQEGAFRCDANVSIRLSEKHPFGTRVEIKNINSFKFVEKAINYEISRQSASLQDNIAIIQETRLYDSNTNQTRSMREKESAGDYRYFPEPDLPPLVLDTQYLDAIRSTLPELPKAKVARFISDYGLSEIDANNLITSKEMAAFFERTIAATSQAPAQLIANVITGDLFALVNKHNQAIDSLPFSVQNFAQLIDRIHDHTISKTIAKMILDHMWMHPDQSPDAVIKAKQLTQITDHGLIDQSVRRILDAHPEQVQELLAGKERIFSFFVGQVMKMLKGKANPEQVNKAIKKHLKIIQKK